MVITGEITKRRSLFGVTALAGWAAIPVMVALALAGRSRRLAATDEFGDPVPGGDGRAWAAATLAMAAVLAGIAAVAVADAIRARRPDGSARPPEIRPLFSILPGVLTWFLGGIVSIGMVFGTSDCGTGADSPCLDHPGTALSALSRVFLLAPTPLLVVVFLMSARSRICAVLAPPFLACVYLVGVHLQLPHAGFGSASG
jgi:hypothetical protein